MKIFSLLLLVSISGCFAAYGQQIDLHRPDMNGVLYVDSAADGNLVGHTWSSAIPSLAEALKIAKALNEKFPDRVKQIWVAKGTYTPAYSADDGKHDEDGGRNNGFSLLKDIKIYGGFAGTEVFLSDRDTSKLFTDNRTVLSGNIGDKDDFTDNVFHVVVAGGDLGNAELNGFVITGGNASTGASGINVDGFVIDNNWGAGMVCYESNLIISHCVFFKNRADYVGGGLYANNKIRLTSCDFIENEAQAGGGVFISQGNSLEITNCTFLQNKATDEGGGGIYAFQSSSIIKNCTFSKNTSTTSGGGVMHVGSYPTYSNCIFKNNEAENGGAMYNSNSSEINMLTCTFSGNIATGKGGGIYNNNSYGPFINCLFSGNKADNGGAIVNDNGARPNIINCTIAGNLAIGKGGGMANYQSTPYIVNTIIWGNSSGVYDDLGSASQFSSNILQEKRTSLGGNLNMDPLFINSEDFSEAPTNSGDYHLEIGSPAFNEATQNINGYSLPLTDFDGNLRMANGWLDIGAYEIQPAVPNSQGVLFVNQAVTGGDGRGGSWENAIPQLSDALRYAKNINHVKPGAVRQIWVAKGTYKPLYDARDYKAQALDQDRKDGGRYNAFVLLKDVKIYGGFSGFETTLAERDSMALFKTNKTVLTGDLGNGDSAFHVVIAAGAVGNARIDGFEISDGSFGGGGTDSDPYSQNNQYSPFDVNDRTILDGGSGMYISHASPTISHCIFSNNNVYANSGGALLNERGAPVITHCSFSGNRARFGGAIWAGQYSSLVVFRCTFLSNSTDAYGQPNSAGGAVFNRGSAAITNCIFAGNEVRGAGNPLDNRIVGGGALYVSSSSIVNCLFSGNKCDQVGGAITVSGSVVIANCTLAGNTANEGSAIYSYDNGKAIITNSIIWGNDGNGNGSGIGSKDNYPTVTHSIVQDISNYPGNGNLDKGTQFMSPYPASYAPIIGGNYHLVTGSWAIGSGAIDTAKYNYHLPATDLDGNPRIVDGRLTMGAYAPAYVWPETLEAEYDGRDSVKLSWDVKLPLYTYVSGDNFEVERSTDSTFQKNVVRVGDLLPYNGDSTHYSIVDDLSKNLKGGTRVYYRLRRTKTKATWGWSKSVKADLEVTIDTTIKADPLKLNNTKAGPLAIITWEPFQGVWIDGETTFTIIKTDSTVKGTPEPIHLGEAEARAGKYIDKNITYCHEYHYSIEVELGNGYDSPPKTKVPGKVVAVQIGGIESLSTSKGYFPDRTTLRWSSEGIFENYVIKRAVYGTHKFIQIVTVPGSSLPEYTFNDKTGSPGVYYKYSVSGMVTCNNQPEFSEDTLYGVGFRSPTGTIYGRVTYANGQAVEAAVVRMEKTGNVQLGQSVYLNGSPDSYLKLDSLHTPLMDSVFTIATWIKPDVSSGGQPKNQVIFSRENEYELGFNKDGRLYFSYKSDSVSAPYVNDDDSYIHITGIHNRDSLAIMVNDSVVVQKKINYSKAANAGRVVYIGRNIAGHHFKGYIDEMSLWNRALSYAAVRDSYHRLLTGGETGLAAYWRFDETIKDQFFDISHFNDVYNMNDGTMDSSAVSHSLVIPSSDQLGLKAKTDTSGNYMITGIPYTGINGTTYTIAPWFGTHQFDPGNVTRLFSSGSATYTINFKDKSSYNVSGTVYYYKTTVPVQGVHFKIDGKTALNSKGEIIQTNSEGKFNIYVPVGVHEVRAVKDNHVFVNNGRITDNHGKDRNYQRPITKMEIFDSTTVKFIGRVAGGAVEEAYPLGHSLSTNNLGKTLSVKLTLPSGKAYFLSTSDTTVLIDHFLSSGQDSADIHRTKVDYNPYDITIYPDPETGEFVAQLIPVKFLINDVEATGWGNILKDKDGKINPVTINLTDKFLMQSSIYIDSSQLVEGKALSDTVLYNASYKFIKRVTPVFSIQQVDYSGRPLSYFGDDTYSVQLLNNKTVDLSLIYPDEKDLNKYRLSKPIFRQNNKYTFRIRSYESYPFYVDKNKDILTVNGEEVIDEAPTQGGEVTIYNELDRKGSKADTMRLDEKGLADYTFYGGSPSFASGGVKHFSAEIKIGATHIEWAWNGQPTMSAFVLGGLETGTDFTTAGPRERIAVLRDPPGNRSFSSIGKDLTYTTTTTYSGSVDLGRTDQVTQTHEHEVVTFEGEGFGTITEQAESKSTLGLGIKQEAHYVGTRTKVTTTTFTTDFQTSSDPAFVGAPADLFIGYATNLTFGESKNLIIIKADELKPSDSLLFPQNGAADFLLVERSGINIGQTFNTMFAYPQQHIIKVLIPNLIAMRNDLFWPKGTAPSQAQHKANESGRYIYVSKFDPDDSTYFGRSNDDEVFGADTSTFTDGPSYHIYIPKGLSASPDDRVDSVALLNEYIASWEDWLRDNEAQKVFASISKAGLIKNYSFHAGSPIHYAEQYSIKKDTSNAFSIKILGTLNAEDKGTIFGEGVKWTMKAFTGTTQSGDFGQTTDSTATHGFTLAADGSDEYISVDVTRGTDGGFVFVTKGGVTGCPYEGKMMTKYLKPSQQIGQPTSRIEVPEIEVDDPVATNVPSTRSASFKLLLRNNSEAELPVNFVLSYANTDSVKGAYIAVDGSSLAGGRTFAVPYGKTVTKVLTLRKGPNALDYNNIPIILHSACQYDVTGYQDLIADTVLISAHFVPSCSDIHVAEPIDKWILNAEAPHNAKGNHYLPVTLNNFDVSNSLFDHITLEYKPSASSRWRPVVDFYTDPAKYDAAQGDKILVSGAQAIHYDLEMDEMSFPDQPYDIRALSVCDLGAGQTVSTASNVVSGIKDTYLPRQFGSAQPADGILDPEDDIRLNFNEPIAAGLLKESDVVATGIRNGAPNDHSVSVRFDGQNDKVVSEFDKNLTGKDITVAMWILSDGNGKETLFSQGNANESMELGLTADNHLEVIVGKRTIQSDKPLDIEPGSWAHVAMVYHQADSTVSAFYNYKEVIHPVPVGFYQGKGPFSLGYSMAKKGNYFAGKMHDVQVWTKVLSSIALQENSVQRLSGSENGLLAYYPMTKGKGHIIFDKAHGNNASLTGNWDTPPGKAMRFNGDGYVKMKTGAIPVTREMNYTLGLWFKGAPGQKRATLVSNGKGDGTDPDGVADLVWLGFENGRLTFKNNGFTVRTDSSYLDNQWHHVAITVNRSTGVAQLYVDGALQKYFDAMNVGGIVSADTYLGVRAYFDQDNAVTPHYDAYFKGEIDDYRLWNTYMAQSYLSNNNNIRLEGNEMGLLAYYPFERYETHMNNKFLDSTLRDMVLDSAGPTPYAIAVNAEVTNQMAPIKDRGPVSNLNIDYVVNNDALIIKLKEKPSLIDKTIVTLRVGRLFDQHGNKIASPITWTAYIDQNPLGWSDDALNLAKAVNKPMQFESYIINSGGSEEKFRIGNLPPWLTADVVSGTVPPEGKQKITFTINQGLNVGSYDNIIEMTNDLQETQGLALNLKVTGNAPDWKVNPADYPYSMTVYGKLRINHIFSDNPEDMLAAFMGGKCVGVAYNTYIKKNDFWYVFLTIYSDSLQADNLSFRIWNAGNGKIYTGIPSASIAFKNDTVAGSPRTPVIFDGRELMIENIPLQKGWNWLSFNLYNNKIGDADAMLANGSWQPGDMIKNPLKGFDGYSVTEGWLGTLPEDAELDNLSLYKLKTGISQVLSIEGTPLDIKHTPIPLQGKQWNYISYIPLANMTVDEALAGYHATNGDQIKSQTGFAMYDNRLGWVGSLNYLEPGKGYMLYRTASSDTAFTYPSVSGILRLKADPLRSARLNPYELPSAKNFYFADNMTVVAQVDRSFHLAAGDTVLAFAGTELRAKAQALANPLTGKQALFFNIPGKEVQLLHFEVERHGEIVARTEPVMSYHSGNRIGSLARPVMLYFGKEQLTAGISPNPFHDKLTIQLHLLPGRHTVQMAIYNMQGQCVFKHPPEKMSGKAHLLYWDGRNNSGANCDPGVYLLHIQVGGKQLVYKVVKY